MSTPSGIDYPALAILASKGDSAALQKLLQDATAGAAEAQLEAGVLHARGAGVAQDFNAARLWYERAEQQGMLNARYNLGVLYLHGQGVARDLETALQWFERAASAGHTRAVELATAVKEQLKADREEQLLLHAVGANKVAGSLNVPYASQCVKRLKVICQDPRVRKNLLFHAAGLGLNPVVLEETRECLRVAREISSATPLSVDVILLCARENVWDALDEKLADSGDSSFTAAPSAPAPDPVKPSPRKRQAPVIELDSGRRVAIDSFSYSRTYAGLLEGRPSSRVNLNILRDCVKSVLRQWGDRKVHLISPEIDETNPNHPELPPAQLSVWLTSTPLESGYCGSALVVVWFSEECESESLLEIVRRAVSTLHWEELAEDFDF